MTVKVKICGIKNSHTIDKINQLNVDFVGFVMFEKSKRNVTIEKAEKLTAQIKNNIKKVLVLVDPNENLLNDIKKSDIKTDFIQLHGNEKKKQIAQIKNKMQKYVIKAVKILPYPNSQNINQQIQELQLEKNDKIIFDTAPNNHTQLPGGNAITFYWPFIKHIKCQNEIIIAGGINYDNIEQAVKQTGVRFVDLSSALEDENGDKDPQLIENIIYKARSLNL